MSNNIRARIERLEKLQAPADRALAKLDEWERHIEKLTPGDQLLIGIAKGSLANWLEQHGQPGRIAIQLHLLAEVVNKADPTVLK